ncbi:DUF3562 domain-containing protein [Cupriavidus sp. SK-3]|uniref:DUF3562 domain-containing protein n=1 Tax=Cupriavidus sp. SK-3 TaxID=1470558 RepID=UPI0012682D0F
MAVGPFDARPRVRRNRQEIQKAFGPRRRCWPCPIAFPSAHAQPRNFFVRTSVRFFLHRGSRYAKIYAEMLQDFIAEARIQDYVRLFVAKRVKGAYATTPPRQRAEASSAQMNAEHLRTSPHHGNPTWCILGLLE